MKHISITLLATVLVSACTSRHKHMDHSPMAAPANSSFELMLTSSQIALGNITTASVGVKTLGQTVVINGTLTQDQNSSEVISSRAAGRIEKLFIKETGQQVKKGQPLYTLYSEGILTLQQEYLLAKEQFETVGKSEGRYKSFLASAERKLLLYGITQSQIDQLGKNAAQPRITFLSPISGTITSIDISDGQYVSEGTALYKVEDFQKLWIEAELYPGESSFVKVGDKITVKTAKNDLSATDATIDFINPEYRANSQITVMRSRIDNSNELYRPGQQVQVQLTHSTKTGLAVPTNAVIWNGKGSHVYIKSGNNTFEPKRVKTGTETPDDIEITDGLSVGDTVAVTGAYLLYSELVLKTGLDIENMDKH